MSSGTEYFNERFVHIQSFNQHPSEQCQEKEMKRNSESFTKPLFNEIKRILCIAIVKLFPQLLYINKHIRTVTIHIRKLIF